MQTYLLLGLILFAAGTMLGIPHGLSKRRGDTTATELWRVAHLSTCVGGISLIALSIAMERVFPGNEMLVMLPFSLAAYLFFIACTGSGVVGKGWDSERDSLVTKIIYWTQILASTASVVAVIALFSLVLGWCPP